MVKWGRVRETKVRTATRAASSRFLLPVFFFIVCPLLVAQRLPIRTYTTADGLPRNEINRVVRDSHGFLWFCTTEGLSRFDGYTFTNYGVEQGIPDRDVRDLIETRSGEYWVATFNGVARFNPDTVPANSTQKKKTGDGRGSGPEPRFVYPANWNPGARHANALSEDPDGTIWCGADGGLYQLNRTDGKWQVHGVELGVRPGTQGNNVGALLGDKDGALWIGTWDGLYRRWPDGRLERYTSRNGLPPGEVRALLEDRDGGLWVGTDNGLFLVVPRPDTKQLVVVRTFTMAQGLPHNRIESLLQSSDGRIWIGTTTGLAELSAAPGPEAWKLRAYPHAGEAIEALAEDRNENLWMGTQRGAMRLARNGFSSYGAEEGFGDGGINSIFEDQAGQLCVINKIHGRLTLHRFDGAHFASIPFNLPSKMTVGWGWNQIGFQGHTGDWWLATGQGLYRYPGVTRIDDLAQVPPKGVYDRKNGLGGEEVFRTYEDSRGDVWAGGASEPGSDYLARWSHATQAFTVIPQTQLHPDDCGVTAFAEDRLGDVWMGCYWHHLVRYREGRFKVFTTTDGLPDGSIFSLYLDHLGRLWIATTRGGLVRVDEPGAEQPHFLKLPAVEGLSRTDVECITEDRWGRIYAGTGHGLYRIDPETGRTKRYTQADGLAGDPIVAFRDHSGALWFGSDQGLSRYVPELEDDESRRPPPIRITALRVAGLPYPVSELGETRLAGLVLEPDQSDVQVDFASLNFGVGEVLRYQFRLEGGDQNWSAPSDERSLSFARLAPGRYRFEVRAVNSGGIASSEPAAVSFQVLAPVWRRGWFLAVAGLLAGLAVYKLYRYRVAHLVELERVRTRIATDLHDDIGASLSGMAFLSEAVKQQVGSARPEAFDMASEVATTARGLARALSDVVWSIDARRDNLGDLITRVRQFASAVLDAQGIAWSFEAPSEPDKVKLTPEQRHHVFLIFKEALNNIARHAHCASVKLTILVEDRQLRAEIVDDGCGFGPAPGPGSLTAANPGNGLKNMKLRAEQLGGRMGVDSSRERGIRLEFAFPLK